MINERAQDQDLVNIPFKVVTDHFKYLGICVTRQFNFLFKSNFLPLLETVQAKAVKMVSNIFISNWQD